MPPSITSSNLFGAISYPDEESGWSRAFRYIPPEKGGMPLLSLVRYRSAYSARPTRGYNKIILNIYS